MNFFYQSALLTIFYSPEKDIMLDRLLIGFMYNTSSYKFSFEEDDNENLVKIMD